MSFFTSYEFSSSPVAIVLKNYVYRRNSSMNGSSGPASPATSTTSTDDGARRVSLWAAHSFALSPLESDAESTSSTLSFQRFSFDTRSVLDDDRRRLLKKYREIKKKVKVLFRRQKDHGRIFYSHLYRSKVFLL